MAALNDEASAKALEAEAESSREGSACSTSNCVNGETRHATGREQDLYVTFRKAILPDEEANMLAIPRKQRAMVRKGIKNELKSEIDPGVDRFFALYADNVHRHGTPAHAEALLPGPARHLRQRLRGADRRPPPTAKPLSSVLSFYFRDEVLPYYAGDDVAARDLAANDFKYWELMRRACARGSEGLRLRPQQAGHRPLCVQEELGLRADAAAL